MGYYIDFVFQKDVTRGEVLDGLSRIGAVLNADVDGRKGLDEFWYPGAAAWTGQAIQVLVYARESIPQGNWAHTRLSWATDEGKLDDYFAIIFRFADDIGSSVYDGQIGEFLGRTTWRELTLENLKKSARAIVGMVGSTGRADDDSQSSESDFGQPEELWSWRIRTESCLRKAGISTIDALLLKSEQELLALPNFSLRCLHEVRERLAAHGLALREESLPRRER